MKTCPVLSAAFFLLAVSAFAARPVARWDVIPDQRVSGVFHAGVCAFHEDGVKVAFTVNGKPAGTAANPTLNPRTKVWEFVLPLDTAKLPDGPVVLGATATTLGAAPESYELPEMPLFANGKGSLSVKDVVWADSENGDDSAAGTEAAPLKTLAAAVRKVPVGGTVYLKAGLYDPGIGGGMNRPYWTTIAAAPGVGRDKVEVCAGRPGTNRLRFQSLTLFCDADKGYCTILAGEQGKSSVWVDDCVMLNKKGRWSGAANAFGNRYVAYVTGGLTTEMENGPGATLIRDHRIETLCSDVWTGSDKLVVNCSASDVHPGDTKAHPDFHQSHTVEPNWVHDVILYNVSGDECTCQGLFGIRLRNSAFVNVSIERTPNNYFHSQYSGPMENVLFAHVTLFRQPWLWREGFAPKDVRMFNCLVPRMGGGAFAKEELFVHHNHFSDTGKGSSTYGSDFTQGDPLFVKPSPDGHDYSLQPGSPAARSGIPLQCVPCDLKGRPYPVGPRPCGAWMVATP